MNPLEGFSVGEDGSAGWLEEADHGAEERGLAAAGGAEECEDFSFVGGEGDVGEDGARGIAEGDGDVAGFADGRRGGSGHSGSHVFME